MTSDTKLNLHQRLASLAEVLGDIKPSSKNQYGAPALGRGDIERAIRKPLGDAGIVIAPSHQSGPPALRMIEGKLWQVDLVMQVFNADNPTDFMTCYWSDIGTNPAAAMSFALKSFYKALFHLDDENDEADQDSARLLKDRTRQPRTVKPEVATVAYATKPFDTAPDLGGPTHPHKTAEAGAGSPPNIKDIMAGMERIAKLNLDRGDSMSTLKLVKQWCLTELGLNGSIAEMREADVAKVRKWIVDHQVDAIDAITATDDDAA